MNTKIIYLLATFLALSVTVQGQAEYEYRYWFDDQAEISQYGTSADSVWTLPVDASSLDEGVHLLHVQVKDTAKRWSTPLSCYFLKEDLPKSANAQVLYWFDKEKADARLMHTDGASILDVSHLSRGLHTLHYQVQSTDGRHSPTRTAYFLNALPNTEVYTVSCYVNDSLYARQEIGPKGAKANWVFDVEELPAGLHTVAVQMTDSKGEPFYIKRGVFMRPEEKWNWANAQVLYWFDEEKADARLMHTDGASILDVSHLSRGLHTLHYQVQSTDGRHSPTRTAYFLNALPNTEVYTVSCYVNDSLYARQEIGPKGAKANWVFDVEELPAGLHTVAVQMTDSKGEPFYIKRGVFMRPEEKWNWANAQVLYWFDEEKADAQLMHTDGASILDVSHLSRGLHTLHYQVQSTDGRHSPTRTAYFLNALPNTEVYTVSCYVNDSLYARQEIGPKGAKANWVFDVEELPAGLHTVAVQMTDSKGEPFYIKRGVFMRPEEKWQGMNCVYTLDEGKTLHEIPAASENGYGFEIDTDTLSEGVHNLMCLLVNGEGTVMHARNYSFFKKQSADVVRYDYWVNDDEESLQVMGIPSATSDHVVEMLEVESYPIRPSYYHFEVEKDVPYIYAKNDLHVRFYNSEGGSAEESRAYADAATRREVTEAIWLMPHSRRTDKTPAEDSIRWYKLEAEATDELVFRVSQPCSVEVYSPVGETLLTLSGGEVTDTFACLPATAGICYVALHDVTGTDTLTSIDYMRFVYSYTDGQGIIYTLDTGRETYDVTGYTEELASDIVVADTLFGLPVRGISARALADAEMLESIVIPASVASVGEAAFSGCHNLLAVEWNATAPVNATSFDAAAEYGNMLVFTNHPNCSFDGNVVVDGVAERITLVDRNPFRNPREFTAWSISYSREFHKKTRPGVSGGWEGIVLPFDVQTVVSEEKGQLAPFGVADFSTTLPFWLGEWQRQARVFAMVQSMNANQPFIMEVPNSEEYAEEFNIEGTITFMSENVTVKATAGMDIPPSGSGFTLLGSYEGKSSAEYVYALNDEEYTTDEGIRYLPGGVFVEGLRDVRPFEAYISHAAGVRSRYLPIGNGGSSDGIPVVMLKSDRLVDVYSLQGILIRSQIPAESVGKDLPRGIYIAGGKKVFVK